MGHFKRCRPVRVVVVSRRIGNYRRSQSEAVDMVTAEAALRRSSWLLTGLSAAGAAFAKAPNTKGRGEEPTSCSSSSITSWGIWRV